MLTLRSVSSREQSGVEACDLNLAPRLRLGWLEDIIEHNSQCNTVWSAGWARQRDLCALLGAAWAPLPLWESQAGLATQLVLGRSAGKS